MASDRESSGNFYYDLSMSALRHMPLHIPNMTPLSLPDPINNVGVYITALLARLYSALRNSWIDASSNTVGAASSAYKPAVPTLRAEVSQARVYGWLALQLLFTLTGLAFLWLQSGSRYPLITDTEMVAFDIDTTEVSKPCSSGKLESDALLRVKSKGDGWKITVAN